MSKIGILKAYNNGNYEELRGEIKTLHFTMQLVLTTDVMKTNENAPDYIVSAITSHGEVVDVGAAWKKHKQKDDGSTLVFLSLTIDDLSLPQPMNVAAFQQDDGSWEISWRRRQVKAGISNFLNS